MNKFFFIATILFFGVLALPRSISACGNNEGSENDFCKKEVAKNSATKSCCAKAKVNSQTVSKSTHCTDSKIVKHGTQQTDDCCGGNCNHGNCNCAPNSIFFTLTPTLVLARIKSVLLYDCSNFRYQKNYRSNGFYFIWSPPNIG